MTITLLRHCLLTTVLVAALVHLGAADDPLANLATYDRKQGCAQPASLARLVHATPAAERSALERKLITVLTDARATADAKGVACDLLAIIASDACVPALQPLLVDAVLSPRTRNVLLPLPDAAVLPALRQALQQATGRTRAGLAFDLGQRGDVASVAAITALATDADTALAGAAIAALGNIGGDDAAKALAGLVPRSELAAQRADASLCIAERFLAARTPAKALAIYRTLMAPDQSPAVRIAALQGVAHCAPDQAVPPLMSLVTDTDTRLAGMAATVLATVPGTTVTTAIAASLDGLAATAQPRFLRILALRADATAAPAVARLVAGNPAVDIRCAALDTLAVIADADQVVVIAAAARDADVQVQTAARAALMRCHGPGVDAELIRRLSVTGPERETIMAILGERRCQAAIQPLLKIAAETNTQDAAVALDALGRIAGPAELPALVALVVTHHGSEAAEKAVASVIKRLSDRSQAEVALVGVHDQARGAALPAVIRLLGQTAGAKALATVAADAGKGDATAVDTAVRTLAAWPDDDAIAHLLTTATSSTSPVHRTLALRGVLRLSELPGRSTEQNLEAFKQALTVATSADDRRLMLGGLAKLQDAAVLPVLEPLFADEAVQAEAAGTYLAIVDHMPATDRPAAWRSFLASSTDAALRDQVALRLKVFEEQGVNLALGAEANNPDGLKPDGAAGGPEAAIDGRPDTYWDEEDKQKLYQLRVKMRASATVRLLRITGYQQHHFAPKDFEVLCDGKVATTVKDAQYQDNVLTVPLPAPTVCTTVELKITGSYGGSPAIRELEIIGR